MRSVEGGAPAPAWPTPIPELITGRLRLRAPVPRDAASLLAVLGDPEVTRYHNVPTLATLAEARALLERLGERHAARETIRWAIELAEPGEMIGTVGLLRFDFEHRRAEVGYEIGRRWWGQGLAPEAAAAVIRYGFTALGLHRIEAGVLPGNDASVRVLQKLGFREEGARRDYLLVKGRFQTFRWFGLLESDPLPGPAR
jgi:ribosomal-protein-alanine N-acetyltransferase